MQGNKKIYFNIEEVEGAILDSSLGTMRITFSKIFKKPLSNFQHKSFILEKGYPHQTWITFFML